MIGFESIKLALLNSYHQQKLHHAILLNGKKGIGKASFAKELALEILDNKFNPHPDLFLISKDTEKREIGIDKIRAISSFVNQTSAISKNKFIIIDSACELNKSASNALLKILEEPRDNNFLILISHNLNRILPTIRSRCLTLKAPDLSTQNLQQILQQNNLNFSDSELFFLSEICDKSPAIMIDFGPELSRFYELFLRSIINKKISEELFKKISDKNFPFIIFEKSIEFFFSRLLKFLSSNLAEFFFEEEKIFLNLRRKFSAEKIFIICDKSLNLLHKTSSFALDKKLTFINIFNQICYD
ncbi:MAG: AAA family ATPase [Rickettsiales bacterium]|nr:AAA family ATPase [Rickettsiales bacterium]